MAPVAGIVYHFSEHPTIREFVPHVAKTAADSRPFVWAVEESRMLDPRAMAWQTAETTVADRDLVLGPGHTERVHAVEYGWLDAIKQCQLFTYRLPSATFGRSTAQSRARLSASRPSSQSSQPFPWETFAPQGGPAQQGA